MSPPPNPRTACETQRQHRCRKFLASWIVGPPPESGFHRPSSSHIVWLTVTVCCTTEPCPCHLIVWVNRVIVHYVFNSSLKRGNVGDFVVVPLFHCLHIQLVKY